MTNLGHPTIMSACFYVNHLIRPRADWKEQGKAPGYGNFYHCNPIDYVSDPQRRDLLLGGIITMWGEYADASNIEADLWPRSSAAAEKLWSQAADVRDPEKAAGRLHEQRCRLNWRGYRAAPHDGPDFCPYMLDSKR